MRPWQAGATTSRPSHALSPRGGWRMTASARSSPQPTSTCGRTDGGGARVRGHRRHRRVPRRRDRLEAQDGRLPRPDAPPRGEPRGLGDRAARGAATSKLTGLGVPSGGPLSGLGAGAAWGQCYRPECRSAPVDTCVCPRACGRFVVRVGRILRRGPDGAPPRGAGPNGTQRCRSCTSSASARTSRRRAATGRPRR